MTSSAIRYATMAYGDEPGVYRQAVMLVVSLIAHAPEPYEIVIATDHPERFVWFGTRVEIEFLTADRFAAWRRTPTVSLREKLELRGLPVPAWRAVRPPRPTARRSRLPTWPTSPARARTGPSWWI